MSTGITPSYIYYAFLRIGKFVDEMARVNKFLVDVQIIEAYIKKLEL